MNEGKELNKHVGVEKKVYQKPILSKVQLVAEEAVLAICKWGPFNCAPSIDCNFTLGS